MKIKTQEARLNKGTALQKLTKHTNPIKLGKKRTTLIQVLALLVAVTIASSSAAETLWVTDFGECRVLGYQSPFTHAMAASMVLGAKDMNTGCGSTPSAPNAENLLWPNISAFVGRYLAVADSGNSRVLFFAPPFGAGAAASLVY